MAGLRVALMVSKMVALWADKMEMMLVELKGEA